ncbi:MAG: hypothetical protein LBI28_07935 [Treponema sp.]|jgi:hypothetical protein|nr:hypothetical protein [Treponema sp.]
MSKFIEFIQNWFHKLTPEQKRRLALVSTAVFSLILTISVIVSVKGSGGEKKPEGPGRLTISAPIPAEDLFLPDEPDYIPGVLLEREQRTVWTEEDAAEHWQDPLKFGEGQWRDKIEEAIDELLERVP